MSAGAETKEESPFRSIAEHFCKNGAMIIHPKGTIERAIHVTVEAVEMFLGRPFDGLAKRCIAAEMKRILGAKKATEDL
jgi:hypothetical protein